MLVTPGQYVWPERKWRCLESRKIFQSRENLGETRRTQSRKTDSGGWAVHLMRLLKHFHTTTGFSPRTAPTALVNNCRCCLNNNVDQWHNRTPGPWTWTNILLFSPSWREGCGYWFKGRMSKWASGLTCCLGNPNRCKKSWGQWSRWEPCGHPEAVQLEHQMNKSPSFKKVSRSSLQPRSLLRAGAGGANLQLWGSADPLKKWSSCQRSWRLSPAVPDLNLLGRYEQLCIQFQPKFFSCLHLAHRKSRIRTWVFFSHFRSLGAEVFVVIRGWRRLVRKAKVLWKPKELLLVKAD